MPTPIPDETNLSIEDLQEAIKKDAFGGPTEEQDILTPGEDLTHAGEEPEQPIEPQPEPEPVQGDQEEVAKEPVGEPEPTLKVLTDEELKNFVVKAKVNGREVEYTWEDLKNIKQTQDAASEKLNEYKELLRAARESVREEGKPQPQPQVEEYLTEEERRDRELEAKIKEIERHQRNFESSQLAGEEERYMRTAFEKEGLTEDQAGERIKRIVNSYPSVARFASKLFNSNPQDADDLEWRKATFDIIWQLNKTIEMPEVIQKIAAEAEAKGKTQAKIDAKRNLADASQGQVDMREPSKEDRLRELAKKKLSDNDIHDFLMEHSVVVKSFD